ncbi:MAG: hypothetical protein Q9217_001863 [Psora testacea]
MLQVHHSLTISAFVICLLINGVPSAPTRASLSSNDTVLLANELSPVPVFSAEPECVTLGSWKTPTFTLSDCVSARRAWGQIFGPDDTLRTCELALVMLDAFYPTKLPNMPTGPFSHSEIGTARQVDAIVENVYHKCISNRAGRTLGYGAFGNKGYNMAVIFYGKFSLLYVKIRRMRQLNGPGNLTLPVATLSDLLDTSPLSSVKLADEEQTS